ncbi:hypothetical protein RUM44_000241 [Polyplax serrata]|uniref:Endonuclease/exonuclease/phosphatase domain-containing protein n=1 Tax=Polyplax serrata TaxID=468196 RepID=A0ABR1B5D1_POLSC
MHLLVLIVTLGVLMIPVGDLKSAKPTGAGDLDAKPIKVEDVCPLRGNEEFPSVSPLQNVQVKTEDSGLCQPAEEKPELPEQDITEAVNMTRIKDEIKSNLRWIRWTEYTSYAKEMFKANKWESVQEELISVASYNVLSQVLLEQHRYLYKNHDERSLKWKSRSLVLLEEFANLNADILCLQEVDSSLISTFYNYHLEKLGYQGIYKRRTNDKVDGCAVYFKKDKFNLVQHLTVELYKPSVYLLNRDNIGIILKLSLKSKPEVEFIVATTHLLYNPKRGDIRLVQTQLMLAEIEKMAYMKENSLTQQPDYLPIILTGDMNYSPDNGVYQLVTTGFLEYEGVSSECLLPSLRGHILNKTLLPPQLGITDSCQYVASLSKRGKCKSLSFSSGVLDHQLNLESAYDHDKSNFPEATTNQNRWVTVDYIFYSQIWDENMKLRTEGSLKLVSRLTLPNSQEAEAFLKHIPNFACGSDHFPLMATFQVKGKR